MEGTRLPPLPLLFKGMRGATPPSPTTPASLNVVDVYQAFGRNYYYHVLPVHQVGEHAGDYTTLRGGGDQGEQKVLLYWWVKKLCDNIRLWYCFQQYPGPLDQRPLYKCGSITFCDNYKNKELYQICPNRSHQIGEKLDRNLWFLGIFDN